MPLFKGSAPHPPPRIERWAIGLQHYEMDLAYRPSAKNPAPILSRHPDTIGVEGEEPSADATKAHLDMISALTCPRALTLEDVATAAEKDPVITKVRDAVQGGQWRQFLHSANSWSRPEKESLMHMWRVRNELSLTEGDILLRGPRIVIPASLQLRATQLAQGGHQGVEKMKTHMWEKVWFQGMDACV